MLKFTLKTDRINMIKYSFLLIFGFLINPVFSQNKKDQIINLNARIDSLNNELDQEKKQVKEKLDEIYILKNQLTEANKKDRERITEITQLKVELNEKIDSIKILIEDNSWMFNCVEQHYTKECIQYEMLLPWITSSPFPDSINQKINNEISQIGFAEYIPKIMNDTDCSQFKNELDCNEEFKSWEVRVCDAPITYWSYMDKVEHKKYLSLVNQITIGACGTTAPAVGYLSFNMRMSDLTIIEFVETKHGKEKLIQDVTNYYINMPFDNDFYEGENYKYDVVTAIRKWKIDDLSFYFKNNKLHLIFSDNGAAVQNKIHEIPLPIFQDFLNL